MVRVNRVILYILILVLFASSFSGCQQSPAPPLEDLFSYITNEEYPRIYTMLSKQSKTKVSLDTFCTRFELIYPEIAIDDITSTIISVDEQGETTNVVYDLSINSRKFDNFTWTFNVTFVKENREWKLVYSPSLIIPGMKDSEIIRISSTPPIRGEIFDRNGDILAQNDYAISVYANVDKIEDGDEFVNKVAPLIEKSPEYVKEKIHSYYDRLEEDQEAGLEEKLDTYKSYDEIIVLKAYPKDIGISNNIKNELLAIVGIGIEEEKYTRVRYYPQGSLLSHTLGYTGLISQEEYQARNEEIPNDTIVGKTGLEAKYENILCGRVGYTMNIVNEKGEIVGTPVKRDVEHGEDVRLNIDIPTQTLSEVLLMEHLRLDMAGCAIVLDPSTGEIQAMASYPTYDPNIFSFDIPEQLWKTMNSKESQNPMYNRLTLGLYPPGSTFKPFTAAIALDSGTLTPDYVFNGKISRNLWTPTDDAWTYPAIKRFSRTDGDMDLYNSTLNSDNIYFAYAALEVGSDRFYQYSTDYGFSTTINSDLHIATPRLSNSDGFENINQLANTGYGQGEMLISPVQMASMFSIFANNGKIMEPHIVKSISGILNGSYIDKETTSPKIWLEDIISDKSINTIEPILKDVVRRGTAKGVRISGQDIYGKTGTAEIGNDKSREIAWFIGFTYESSPKLVCVVVEVPAGEGAVRFPIAKELLRDTQ